jgi:hypothetical protein
VHRLQGQEGRKRSHAGRQGYVMQSLECPKCSDLYRIVIRRGRSHAGYRAAFVDSTDHQDNIKLEGAGGCTPPRGARRNPGPDFFDVPVDPIGCQDEIKAGRMFCFEQRHSGA